MKIRFDSYDDDQPSDKISYFSDLNIIVESVFRIENEYYPQSHLIGVYYIECITKNDEYKINSVNPLYLLADEIDGFVEEKKGSKYLNIATTDSNNEVLKNMKKFGVEL